MWTRDQLTGVSPHRNKPHNYVLDNAFNGFIELLKLYPIAKFLVVFKDAGDIA
jgi:hypothetical protein